VLLVSSLDMAKREAEYTTTFAFVEFGRFPEQNTGVLGTRQKGHASRSDISGTTIIWTTCPLFVNDAEPSWCREVL
jgi:hypothetical protein